jgi:hypothetical protein
MGSVGLRLVENPRKYSVLTYRFGDGEDDEEA